VKLSDWPGAVPTGAAIKTQDVVGRGVITPIFAKEPIIESRVAAKGAGGGLAAMIPPGMRAVPIRVNEVVGVAGFVVPGMRVDVMISGSRPNQTNALGTITRTLLQNLEVLSAGTDFKKDPEGKPIQVQVINLLVTPEQAEVLSLASAQTQIQLSLRNPLDHDMTKTPGTALGLLFDGGKMKLESDAAAVAKPRAPRQAVVRPLAPVQPFALPPAPKKEEPFVMEIISGTKKAEQKFTNPGEGK
jgi:pilus assembly protein CpaB